jgi:hypothetical protein
MGKEYIMDTVSLEGVESPNELTKSKYKLTQIVANVEFGEKERNLPVFSVATTGGQEGTKDIPSSNVSIGGFVDETIPIRPISVDAPNNIRFYTGERLDPTAIANYPGAERLTITSEGRVGINSPNSVKWTLDVREALPFEGFDTPGRPRTSSIAITQPFYKSKRGDTTPEFGNIFFRANVNEEMDTPVTYSLITSSNEGQVQNSYDDQRANLVFLTNTINEEGARLEKHLEINGLENKTKIFTQLNLGNVPAFRDLKEAINGGLVTGDVWQDSEGTLKIMPDLSQGGERARIE